MAMASAQAADAWQATAPIITVAERRSAAVETVHSVAGAAEHDGGVRAVGQHERAQVVGGARRVDQRRPEDLGHHEQGDGDDGAVEHRAPPTGCGGPGGRAARR